MGHWDVAAHLTEELREDLLARWSEPHRKHHTVTHLHEMLDAIGVLAESGLEFDREAVEFAGWFHDAICEIGRDDNEDSSAELARELLASSPVRDEVARLVLVTKTHKVADGDVNGAVLCDADLSVLGSDTLPVPELRGGGPRGGRRDPRRGIQTRARPSADGAARHRAVAPVEASIRRRLSPARPPGGHDPVRHGERDRRGT